MSQAAHATRQRALWHPATIAAACLSIVCHSAAAHDIGGTVTTQDGAPIAGAAITIVSTIRASGTNTESEWCDPDCGKHAVSDEHGMFVIAVANEAIFMLSAEARGFSSHTLLANSRTVQPLQFKLAAHGTRIKETSGQYVGRVIDINGRPVAGANIGLTQFGLTATDREGWFLITAPAKGTQLSVFVNAPGYAPNQSFRIVPGKLGNTLWLLPGATVRGRVLEDARPARGVAVAIVRRLRVQPEDQHATTAATDGEGRFTFENVEPNCEFVMFVPMESVAGRNRAAISRVIRSGRAGQTVEEAELNLHPAHRVSGRVVFERPPDFPVDSLNVQIGRKGIADTLKTQCDAEGNFVLQGVPSESVWLGVHSRGVRYVHGHRLSPMHYNLHYLSRSALCGRVDEDVEIAMLLERGSATPIRPHGDPLVAQQVIVRNRNGVQQFVAMPNAAQRDPLLARQLQLEEQPLRGISPEALDK